MKRLNLIRGFAVTLIILSLLGLVPLGYFWVTGKVAEAEPAKPLQHLVLHPSPELITGTPTRISIPSLNIDIQVAPGDYNAKTKEWTLSLDKAHFAAPSVAPNNLAGNTLIYGHYRPEVFAYLHNITAGATAVITTNNGYTFNYTFKSSEAVNPADTSIFTYSGKPRLTIQTCSGAFMQNRQMYYFDYNGYTKP